MVKRPVGETRKKRPLEGNGQMQEAKENVQVAPHVSDGEEPTKKKQRVVLYHGVRPIELRKFGILQKNIQQWLKSFCDGSHMYL